MSHIWYSTVVASSPGPLDNAKYCCHHFRNIIMAMPADDTGTKNEISYYTKMQEMSRIEQNSLQI